MARTNEWRTSEYVIRLRGRQRAGEREWIIELEFLNGPGKATLHTETNRTRAEGAYEYLTDHVEMACQLAKKKIGQMNFFEPGEGDRPMSEERAPYNAGEQPGYIDEYFIRRLGPEKFEVYRLVGKVEMHYCLCETVDAALLIARALNFTAAADARTNEPG